MRPNRQALVALSLCAISAFAEPIHASQDQVASSTAATSTAKTAGTAVGAGISAVLSAAFPAVATIINAIWGNKPNQNKRASDAQPPLNALQKTSATQLSQLSVDLSTVNIYLVNCVMADRSIIKMQAILAQSASISDGDKQKLQANWNDASPRIAELGKDTAKTAASAVSDEYIKRSLLAISEANYGDIKNIQDDINNKNAADLRERLIELEPKLAGVAALSGDVVGQVSAGLHAAAKGISPSQGLDDKEESALVKRRKADQSQFEMVLKDVYGVAPQAN